MTPNVTPKARDRVVSYWHRNLIFSLCLLLVWLLVSFVPVYFARELSGLYLFDWPFPFWMAAFGAQFCFLLTIGLYAWGMDRMDRRERRDRSQES
jgi:putative solute:sodium symporter small subunit